MMRFHYYLAFFILNLSTGLVSGQCVFTPILSGVTPLQTLGESMKKHVPSPSDCKQTCSEETSFTCTAFLWPAEGGDCYLFDRINLDGEIFRDNQDSYVLYVQVCGGAATPSVGFCEFKLNKSSVIASSVSVISPGIATESSCREFCMARYQGRDCEGYVVSPSTNMLSTCSLYDVVPSTLPSGSLNLYTKNCQPPPQSCLYSSWGSWGGCTTACIQTRTRSVVSQPTLGGAPCLDTELTGSLSCTGSPCVPPVATTTAGTGGMTTTTAGSGGMTTTSAGNGGLTTTTAGTGGMTTTTAPLRMCDPVADVSAWTEWAPCASGCEYQRTKALIDGVHCDSSGLTLFDFCYENCAGMGGPGTDPNDDDPSSGGGPNIPEVGCRIDSIDPQTRPSSQGFKAVGAQQDCAARCAAETKFECEAYSTTGPGGSCILHGAVDQITKVTIMSNWYLQDINCVVNSSAATSICGWQMVRAAMAPLDTTAKQWTSLGYAINADHCGTLCMMNHPMYKPNPCEAYAYSGAVPWAGPTHNCYMYTAIDNPWSFTSTGTYDLYKLVCLANATSVASSKA